MDSSKQRDGLPEEVSPTKKWDPRKKSTCDLSVASTLMMTELNQNLPVRVLEIENDDDDIDSDHPVGFSDGGGKQLSKAQAKNFKNLRKKSTTKRTFFWGKRQDNKKRAKNTRKEKKTPTKSHSSDKPQEQKGKGPPVGGVSMVGQGDLTQLANYIRQAALEKKVASGEITIDEFKRLSAPEQASERGQADKSKRLTLTRSSSRKMEKNISNADSFSEIAAQIRRKKEVYTFNYRTGDIISIRVLSDEHCCLGFLRSKKRRFVVADVPFSTVQNDLNFHFKIFKRDQNAFIFAQLPEEELRKTETVFQSMKTKLYLSRPLDKSEVWSEKKPQERESINTQATIWFSYLQDRKDPQPFFLRGDVLNIGITESPLLFEATPIKEANDAQNLSLDVHYGSVAQRPKQTPEEIPRYGTINPPKKKDDSHRKSFSFHRGGKIEKIEREKEKEDLSDFSNIAAKIKEKKRQKGQGGSAIKLQSPPPLPPAPPGPPAPPPPPLPPPVAPLLPLRADSLGDPGSRKESSVRFEVSGALKAPKRGTSRHSQPPMTHAQLTTEMLAAGAEIPKLSTDLRSSSGISLPVPPPPSPSPVVVGRQPSMSPQPVTTPPPPPLPPPSTTSSTNTPPTPPPRTTTPTPHATTRLSTSPLPLKKPNKMTKKLSATTLSKVPPPINVPLPPALGGSSFVSPRGALVPVTPPPAPPLPPALQRENSRVLPCSLSLAKSVSLDPTKEQTPPIIRRGREKTKTPEVKKISSLLVSQISGPLLPPPLSVRAESPLPPPLIVGPAKKPAAPHGLQSFNETPPPIIVDITKVPTTPEIDDRTEQESQPIEKEPKEEREEQEQGEKDKLEERDGEREEEREEEKKKEGEEDITLMGDLSSSFAELDAISGNRPPTETTKVIQEQKEQEQKEQEQREQEQQEQKEQEQREQEQQEQREQEQQEQKEQEQKEQVGITKDHGFDLSGLENYSSFEDGGGVGASMGFDVGGLSFPPHHEGEKSETEGEKSETEERGEGGEGEERGGEGEERGGEGGERVGGGGGGEGLSASELLMRDLEMGETSSPLYHPDDALNGSSSSSFGHVSSSGAGFDLAGLLSELDTSSTLLELTTAATNLGLDLGDFGLDNFPKPQDEILEDSSEEEEDSDIDSEEEEEEEEWDETPSKPDPIESGEKVTFLEVDEFDTLCTLEEASRKFEHKEEVFSLRGKNLELLAELGKGSQATVWKCTIDGLLVALKQINLAGAKDKREVRTAVKKEVDLMKNAQHRNVMRYFGSFFSSKTQELNIITEIISGGPLTKWIQTQGCFSDILCAHVLLQTLEGLHFIHSNRILHRDIKPDNLLIDLDGSVKLVDFGIAAQLENEAAYRNSSVGTPWYTAPEVINGDDYSFGCDIWSLGCTLIEMMTGKPPFHHLNAIATLNIMGEEQPTIPTSFSTLARDFLQQIFIRDPRKRPTAAELLQHPFILENLMEDQHSTIFLT